MKTGFNDAALVLLGHGTELNQNSATPVYQQAVHLRQRRLFGDVREAFWKQNPQIRDVLPRITTASIFIVPLLISEGYFSEDVIPAALGFRTDQTKPWSRRLLRDHQTFFYCKPVGTHPLMTQVVLARARNVSPLSKTSVAPPPAEATLILAGHGTQRNENSRQAIEQQVNQLRRLNIYAAVHAVYLEEEPRIPTLFNLAQTPHIIIVPYFISDGLHTQQDIPALLGESTARARERLRNSQPVWENPTEMQGKLVWYSSSVGAAPEVADVILERVREAAPPENNPARFSS